jgi:DNA-3-methyladenine glycosylase
MRARRGDRPLAELCSGPGKLTQALGIELSENGTDLDAGPVRIAPRPEGWPADPGILAGPRIGITKAADLPWRFCDADSRHVSRPWPAEMRRGAREAA